VHTATYGAGPIYFTIRISRLGMIQRLGVIQFPTGRFPTQALWISNCTTT